MPMDDENDTDRKKRSPMIKGKIRIKQCLLAVLIAYLVYVAVTAVLPPMLRKPISQEFANAVQVSDYYGDKPCVDRVALVETPAEGFDTRLHMLDEAKDRIDISYYAIHMGQTTDQFLGAVLDAADRGVQVRILVDGQSGGLTKSHPGYAAALGGHPNISLKVYNPANPLKPWTWNGRLHDKYILIDDRLLLLGGRNIGDKYFAPAEFDKQLSYDRDVLVYNTAWESGEQDSVLSSVRQYMDTIWNGDDVHLLYQKDTKKGASTRQELLTSYQALRETRPALFDHQHDDYAQWTYPANRITFLHNDPHIGVKEPKAGYTLGKLLLNAKDSVSLQSPYVILDPLLRSQLEQLGQLQIETKILTNSAASSPNPIACAAYHGDRKAIMATGAQLWEYQGENTIHAKSYVIDDRMTVIGSYNLDPRSAYLDTELLLAIDSPAFTQHFQQVQDSYFQQSLQAGTEGGYIAGTIPPRPVSGLKWGMIYALYLPVKLFKYLA